METYQGILREGRIEWSGEAPNLPAHHQGVRVQVTLLERRGGARGRHAGAAHGRCAGAAGNHLLVEGNTRSDGVGRPKCRRSPSSRAGRANAPRQQHHHLRRQAGKRELAGTHRAAWASRLRHQPCGGDLGYHGLTDPGGSTSRHFSRRPPVLPLSDAVLEQAIKLRQAKKMTLGDALIAATALAHNRTLVTRNTKDFAWIAGLSLLDPFAPPVRCGHVPSVACKALLDERRRTMGTYPLPCPSSSLPGRSCQPSRRREAPRQALLVGKKLPDLTEVTIKGKTEATFTLELEGGVRVTVVANQGLLALDRDRIRDLGIIQKEMLAAMHKAIDTQKGDDLAKAEEGPARPSAVSRTSTSSWPRAPSPVPPRPPRGSRARCGPGPRQGQRMPRGRPTSRGRPGRGEEGRQGNVGPGDPQRGGADRRPRQAGPERDGSRRRQTAQSMGRHLVLDADKVAPPGRSHGAYSASHAPSPASPTTAVATATAMTTARRSDRRPRRAGAMGFRGHHGPRLVPRRTASARRAPPPRW